MSTTKPWGRIGAWAADAEAAEAEELAAAEAAAVATAAAIPRLAGESSQSFPSLKEAAAAAKPKKKKATMSLSMFTSGCDVGRGGGARHPYSSLSEPKGLTPDEMYRLPTGPKERTPEELEYGRLGGGFRSYGLGGGGRSGGGGMSGRRDDGDSSWGQDGRGRRSYGSGFDEETRKGPPQSRVSDFEQMPSRADEVDNWASAKKSFAPPMDSGRQERYQSLGSGGGASRADEMDNWSMGKKPLPSRYSGFGSGFRDSSALSDSDPSVRGGGGGPLPTNGDRERTRLVLDPPKGEVGVLSEPVRTRPNPFGTARPREDVLTEKGVDWRKVDSEIDTKNTSCPTSSHSSRPSSAQSSRAESPPPQLAVGEGAPRPRQKVNPFGDAKPREVLLQEKGKDWKKIDFELEHRSVGRPETEQEKMLKEEINRVKKVLAKETEVNHNGESMQYSAEDLDSLSQQKDIMERELELLTHELDDKVRFGQRSTSDRRPGSGSGRLAVFPDRPPSQSGMSEESRSTEFTERPRSHGGMGDMWTKSVDDRRPFQLDGEGGFFGNRNMDRSRSKERW